MPDQEAHGTGSSRIEALLQAYLTATQAARVSVEHNELTQAATLMQERERLLGEVAKFRPDDPHPENQADLMRTINSEHERLISALNTQRDQVVQNLDELRRARAIASYR